jgi:hypothetical protein
VSNRPFARGACALALAIAADAHAASDADLAEIREQIKQLKSSYEARINALEQKLNEAEAAKKATPTAETPAAPATRAASGGNAFNPAVSVVLQGVYANLRQDPENYRISGFPLSADVESPRRGFSLAESELTLAASVDDKFTGSLTFALTPENTVSVEEAYAVATAVPYGIVPKFGRFFSGIGYLNEQHQHVWDFYDAPLVYLAYLGGQYTNDGLQLKWGAPIDMFLEVGAEAGSGEGYPGTGRNKNGIGNGTVYAHAGGDVGTDNSWRAGVSYLQTKAANRAYSQTDLEGNDARLDFSGRSKLAIADFVWKWAPNGNARERSFKLQGEYFWRREEGDLAYDADGALGLTQSGDYASNQRGYYLQGMYQFMPAWRIGLRYDELRPGGTSYGAKGVVLGDEGFNPRRGTVMVDWTPSEYSRFRLQYSQAKLVPGITDNQLFVQYILTLGAHGAHKY